MFVENSFFLLFGLKGPYRDRFFKKMLPGMDWVIYFCLVGDDKNLGRFFFFFFFDLQIL